MYKLEANKQTIIKTKTKKNNSICFLYKKYLNEGR